jgi:surfactin synthase thioesterase subunit
VTRAQAALGGPPIAIVGIGCRFPGGVIDTESLLALLLPALGADIAVIETFAPSGVEPLTFAMTVLGGGEDSLVTLEQLRAWRGYTSGPFRVRQFRGGLFYLNDARVEVFHDVAERLRPAAAGWLAT